jgi:hypothetical protein
MLAAPPLVTERRQSPYDSDRVQSNIADAGLVLCGRDQPIIAERASHPLHLYQPERKNWRIRFLTPDYGTAGTTITRSQYDRGRK